MLAPKTIKEAVTRSICFRPDMSMKIDEWVLANIKDYLNQRFGIAYLRASGDEKTLVILRELYENIFREET